MQEFMILALAVSCGIALVVLNSSSSAAGIAATTPTKTSSAPLTTDEFCGTKSDDAGREELAKTAAVRKWFAATKQPTPKSEVRVHFHVIQNEERGAIDDATIAAQVDVLNASFNLRGISFALASIDRTDSNAWFTGCDAEGPAKKMKKALRLGSAEDLNVYTCEPTRFFGLSAFPWSMA